MVSGFYFSGDLFTILSTSKDSRSLMGGSDVVYCVQVPLIGTTMVMFTVYESVVGIGLCTITYSCVQYRGHWGPIYYCFVMGPRFGNVARAICLIL